jgi:hypothetical protein
MTRIFFNLSVLCFVIPTMMLSGCSSSRVKTGVTDPDIPNAIDSNNWVFTVQQVMPIYGRARQPNGNYTVVCKDQKLEVYLPYFGRATAGVDVYTGRGPLDFTADKPLIKKEQIKPGEWRLQVEPGIREVQTMDFTFYTNGTAHLAVRMSSRSGISYSGTVGPLKKE